MSNISFQCAINQLSYGICGRSILYELSKLANVSLFPVADPTFCEQHEQQAIIKALENAKSYDYNAPCIKLYHEFALNEMPRCSKRIGYPIFELDKFSEATKHVLNSVDKLFVASKWAKSICDRQLNVPVHVIPLGVDTSVYRPTQEKNEQFTILCVGKIEIRKGHDLIPSIVRRALGGSDFKLKMSWNNIFLKAGEIAEWENYYRKELGDKVGFVPSLSTQEMVNLYSSSHVLLSPSRAEGWNMPALEALACGTQVITTNYSGHTEFCNANNSKLIMIDGLEIAEDGKWFHGEGNWCRPNTSHASEIIRFMYDDWRTGKNLFNVEGIKTAQEFTWANTAKKIMESL